MRLIVVACLLSTVAVATAISNEREAGQSRGRRPPKVSEIPLERWFTNMMIIFRDQICGGCMTLCYNPAVTFPEDHVYSLWLARFLSFEKTLEATPLDKCPEVCTKNLQEGLPSRVNLLRDGYFQHAPDIGPDDPRHETINNYVADARGKIKDFECTAQDSFAMPQKSVSKPDRGFGKNVRKGKKRKNRNSGNNGSSNKFSLDVPKVVRNGLASMRHHFDQIFRKEPDQKKSGPKYFPPSRPLRPAF